MICQYKRCKNIGDAVMLTILFELSVMKINALAHQLAPHRLML